MKNKKSKEKNFEVLKERILNNVMSFNDLDKLFKDNGYYGTFDHSLMREVGDKYEVIYKAVDDYHHDLKILLVIDANINIRTSRAFNDEIEGKLPVVIGDNTFKRLLNGEFTGGESLKVVVTDFQISDFLKELMEVLNNEIH